MTEVKAELNSYRQSPRKVRLVADAIRGQKVASAKKKLDVLVKRASSPLAKLLNSAVANAKNQGLDEKNLFVKTITVDGGQTLKRHRPVWRGIAHPIKKRTSHIKIVLSEQIKSETENSPKQSKLATGQAKLKSKD